MFKRNYTINQNGKIYEGDFAIYFEHYVVILQTLIYKFKNDHELNEMMK